MRIATIYIASLLIASSTAAQDYAGKWIVKTKFVSSTCAFPIEGSEIGDTSKRVRKVKQSGNILSGLSPSSGISAGGKVTKAGFKLKFEPFFPINYGDQCVQVTRESYRKIQNGVAKRFVQTGVLTCGEFPTCKIKFKGKAVKK